MKKNEIFTFAAPNGVVVMGIVIEELDGPYDVNSYLCYAQNRLFIGTTTYQRPYLKDHFEKWGTPVKVKKVLVDYCILPDYDSMLEAHSHQLDMANDYASKEL